jgi:hypothetical protein
MQVGGLRQFLSQLQVFSFFSALRVLLFAVSRSNLFKIEQKEKKPTFW